MRPRKLTDADIEDILAGEVPVEKSRLLRYFEEEEQKAEERLHLAAVVTAVERRFVSPREKCVADAREEMRRLARGDSEDILRHNALIPYIEKKEREIAACSHFLGEPYFARMDLFSEGKLEKYYIGKKGNRSLGIMDWRAPVAERYYQKSRLTFDVGGCEYRVVLRRSLRVAEGKLKSFRNEYLNLSEFLSEEEIAGRDESIIYDPFLKELLAERKDSSALRDIIETIQEKQYEVICRPEREHVVVQGAAGSGKTMVLLHRLSYLLYNNRDLRPENILILTPSESFNDFIGDLATTLELTKVETATPDAYYLSLLAPKVPALASLTRLTEKESEEYRAGVYAGGGRALADFLDGARAAVAEELARKAVSDAFERAQALMRDCMPRYEAIKNASFQVRQAVLGEIKEREDGSFLYTRNFRRLMTEGELALAGIGKLRTAEGQSIAAYAKGLRAALISLSAVKKYAAGEISGSVRSLKSREKTLEREIDSIRRSSKSAAGYSKNKLLAAFEERKYREQIDERERALAGIRRALEDVAAISGYFRSLRELYAALAGEAVRFSGLSDPAFAVKYIYNRFIAAKKSPAGYFTASDLYLFVIGLTHMGYDLKRNHSFLFIDEGQDISADEYALLRAVNPTAFFDVFGDVAQNVTPYRGIRDWAESGFALSVADLNRNYRNTAEIVAYVGEKVGIRMLAVGPGGEPVRESGDLAEFFRGVKGLRAAIYKGELPDSLKGREFHLVAKDGKIVKNKINVMTVLESKGLEFTAVAVATAGMTPHEKYIAFTRALARLMAKEHL